MNKKSTSKKQARNTNPRKANSTQNKQNNKRRTTNRDKQMAAKDRKIAELTKSNAMTKATAAPQTTSFGGPHNLDMRDIAGIVRFHLAMILRAFGLDRVAHLCVSRKDAKGEVRVDLTLRPIGHHATNGGSTFPFTVSSRKPNLITMLVFAPMRVAGQDRVENRWTATLDSRFSVSDPWVGTLLWELTKTLRSMKAGEKGVMPSLNLVNGAAAQTQGYTQTVITPNILSAIRKSVEQNFDAAQYQLLLKEALDCDTQGVKLANETIKSIAKMDEEAVARAVASTTIGHATDHQQMSSVHQ